MMAKDRDKSLIDYLKQIPDQRNAGEMKKFKSY